MPPKRAPLRKGKGKGKKGKKKAPTPPPPPPPPDPREEQLKELAQRYDLSLEPPMLQFAYTGFEGELSEWPPSGRLVLCVSQSARLLSLTPPFEMTQWQGNT